MGERKYFSAFFSLLLLYIFSLAACNTSDEVISENRLAGSLLEVNVPGDYEFSSSRREYIFLSDKEGQQISELHRLEPNKTINIPWPDDYKEETFTLNQLTVIKDEAILDEYYYLYSWTEFPPAVLNYASNTGEVKAPKKFKVTVENIDQLKSYGSFNNYSATGASDFITFDFQTTEERPALVWFQTEEPSVRRYFLLDSAQEGSSITYDFSNLPPMDQINANLNFASDIQNASVWSEGFSEDYSKSVTYMNEYFLNQGVPAEMKVYYDQSQMAHNKIVVIASEKNEAYFHAEPAEKENIDLTLWESGLQAIPTDNGVSINLPKGEGTYMYSAFSYDNQDPNYPRGSYKTISWSIYGPAQNKDVILPEIPIALKELFPTLREKLSYRSSTVLRYTGGEISNYKSFLDNYFFSASPIEEKLESYDWHTHYYSDNSTNRTMMRAEDWQQQADELMEERNMLHKIH